MRGFDWPDSARGWLAAIGIGIVGSAFAIGAFLAATLIATASGRRTTQRSA